MAKRDYYEVLGVPKNATPSELKAAFRKKAVLFHPDRNKDDASSSEKFKEVNEAYSVLSDAQKKQAYDQYGHAGVNASAGGAPGGAGFGGFDFGGLGDIFGDLFGDAVGGGRQRGRSRTQPGHDIRVDQSVNLHEVLNGVERTINVPMFQACDTCDGSGAQAGSGLTTCGDCRGAGQVRVSHGFFSMAQTCGRCHGQGQIVEKPCHTCQGKGRVKKSRRVKVRIPPGVEDGTTLRLSGMGEAGERGAHSGDLYVVIQVEQDKQFEREGANLFIERTVSFPLAALGGEIKVPTLEGSVQLKIPHGTQPGVLFRVSEHGLPHLKSRARGDLFVRVQVDIPKKLSKEDKKIIQDLGDRWGEQNVSKDQSVFRKVFGK